MADRSLVSRFDVGDIGTEALLFQTGYLTEAEEVSDGLRTLYRLDCPNLEVRLSLNRGLLTHLGKRSVEAAGEARELLALLEANDFGGFADRLRSFLAGIPYQWHARGDLARYEAWCAGLLYMCLRAVGADVRAEEASGRGRADLAVLAGGQAFVLEFRVVDGVGEAEAALDAALSQMRDRGYAERHRSPGRPVYPVAVACGREARNLLEIRAEPA